MPKLHTTNIYVCIYGDKYVCVDIPHIPRFQAIKQEQQLSETGVIYEDGLEKGVSYMGKAKYNIDTYAYV